LPKKTVAILIADTQEAFRIAEILGYSTLSAIWKLPNLQALASG
jgi:hypothetical protein